MSVIQTASVTGALSAMLGCEVGELPAGAVRKRNIIPQCADCSKAQDGGTHPCWTSLRIEPLNKAVFQWFIGLSNALKAQLRRAQVLNWLNDRMCNGIPFDPSHPDTDYQPPGAAMPISMFRGWWEVVSASGRTVVLRWHTGEFDPNDIQWTLTTTRTVDDDGFPLAEPISTSVTTHCKLPLGILRLGEASQLRDHAGWIITGYSFPEPIVDGDLIYVYLRTAIGGIAMAKVPGLESSAITAGIRFYGPMAEPWIDIVDFDPLWTVPKTWTLEAGETTLEADARVAMWPGMNPSDSRVHIEHNETGGFRTFLSSPDAGTLTITGFIEDISSDNAIPGGSQRCHWCRYDRTGSYGWFCAKKTTASLVANFTPTCTQTLCSEWKVDTDGPRAPITQDLWTQLMRDNPFEVVKTGDTQSYTRTGVPSLAANCTGMALDSVGNATDTHWYGYFSGGLCQHRSVLNEDSPTPHTITQTVPGFEWLEGGGDPEGTWNAYGPAGNRIPDRMTEFDAIASDSTDPRANGRAAVSLGGYGRHKHDGARLPGEWGMRQRFIDHTVYIPVLPSIGVIETRPGGITVERGFWKQDFTRQIREDSDTYYRVHITQSHGFMYNGTEPTLPGIDSVIVKKAEWSAPILTLHLAHKPTTVSGGEGESLASVAVHCGGGNVSMPEWARFSNWASNQANVGQEMTKAREGCVALVGGHKFFATYAKACGSGYIGAFADGSETTNEANLAWYEDNLAGWDGLPPGFQSWGGRFDVLQLTDDESGYLAGITPATLEGQTLSLSMSGIWKPNTLTVFTSVKNNAGADAKIKSNRLRIFAGSGDIWIRTDVQAGHCIVLKGKLANRQSMFTAAEIGALFAAQEAAMR